jgi:hypothetical protein
VRSADPTPFLVDVFTATFRRHVHLLLALGLDAARAKILPDSEEEHITGYIAEGIRYCMRYQKPSWTKFYDVHNEDPIPSDIHPGKGRRPLDLAIVLVPGLGRPEFVFEAKQLNWAKEKQRYANYTNKDGMGRFLGTGDYADYTARFPEVGMLGFVLSDTVVKWTAGLKSAIDAKGPDLLLHGQEDVSIIPDFPLEWTSEHGREGASRPVKIYHILAPCM